MSHIHACKNESTRVSKIMYPPPPLLANWARFTSTEADWQNPFHLMTHYLLIYFILEQMNQLEFVKLNIHPSFPRGRLGI